MTAIGQGNLEYHKLFRVMRTAAEMMADRGYTVPSELVPETFTDFMQLYVEQVAVDATEAGGVGGRSRSVIRRDKMTLPCERVMADGGGEVQHALAIFCLPNGLTSKFIKETVDLSVRDGCQKIIYVTPTKPNAVVKKNVDTNNRSDNAIHMEVFEEDDLAVNITKHVLVPRHTPLEPHDLKAVLQAHALELSQLPRILAADPVARYFGLERGQVVRIERKSESAGVYVTYRQVV